MDTKKTTCYSYFSIGSEGEVRDLIGFVAAANSDFDPAEITKRLGIVPFETREKGQQRKILNNICGVYPSSAWIACRQDTPILDAEAQCLAIVRILKDKIPILQKIKKDWNVCFSINIVPEIRDDDKPAMHFNQEIISFCHSTGTEIDIDLYVFDPHED